MLRRVGLALRGSTRRDFFFRSSGALAFGAEPKEEEGGMS
jgi:hypothetical protein